MRKLPVFLIGSQHLRPYHPKRWLRAASRAHSSAALLATTQVIMRLLER
jgi:hypothetical protein